MLKSFVLKLQQIYKLLTNHYGGNIIITGSSAILMIILHHPLFRNNIEEYLNSLGYYKKGIPNDINFFCVKKEEIIEKSLGKYIADQEYICKSKKFRYYENDNISFDIKIIPGCNYFVLDDMKIISPDYLRREYIEYYRDSDKPKLNFLQIYKEKLDTIFLQTIQVTNKRVTFLDEDELELKEQFKNCCLKFDGE
jgi:hypothetical protein